MNRLLILLITLLACTTVLAQQPSLIVLYDNDVHCQVQGYPVMAGLRDSLVRQGHNVAVVSAGDFSFGGPIGASSKGSHIVRLMNAVGYDAVCLGNHEFDYGISQLHTLQHQAQFPFLSANFVDILNSHRFSPAFVIRNYGPHSVAFIGITTPTTLSAANPTTFLDSLGQPRYHFSASTAIPLMQHTVDMAHAAGADIVVILSHLGNTDTQLSSVTLASQLTGVDLIIDGHDHNTIPSLTVANPLGQPVIITSTGTQFATIGVAQYHNHQFTSKLLATDSLQATGCVNNRVADTLKTIIDQFNAFGNQPIATSHHTLLAEQDGIRICRLRETNLGDLIADAIRTVMGTDIAIVNAGAIRANIPAGPVTHNMLYAVCPFSNPIDAIRVTGADIRNALETGVREYPRAEGCFAQVSGLSFTIDTTVASSVTLDNQGRFRSVDGPYRVSNIMVGDKPLDLNATYTVSGTSFIMHNGGDGYWFPSAQSLFTSPLTELQILEQYILTHLQSTIQHPYQAPQSRILFK